MQRRDRYIAQSLGLALTKRVKDSRILLVGAGGIGCEVLKNLVCCGFGTSSTPSQDPSDTECGPGKPGIVVIDLDTIDLSNLNRQFLFRKHHIKSPKALVAKETARQFNPAARIEAHHASIFDEQYNVEFFESFDIVFNALDNLAARRHVNRMCLAANVLLIESGTTGFNGQVQVIQKGVTECYDCNPKPVQKSFPICTIRSTPSQPIHCIVWAKSYLLPELFGTSDEATDMTVTEGDNAEEVAKLKEEAEALSKVRGFMGKPEFAQEVFNKVFRDDIERLRSMSEMWQSRKAPESLGFEALTVDENDHIKRGQALATSDQAVWGLRDNVAVFCYSLDVLSSRVGAGETVIEFDKDDKDTLDFVAAAANLRSHIFGMPLHSEWDIKQMAGNIIPAIATSNALTASLCLLQAFKIMKSLPAQTNGHAPSSANSNNHHTNNLHAPASGSGALLGGAKMVFLNSRSTDRVIVSQDLVAPNKTCPVCSPVYAKLLVPSGQDDSLTLQHLVDLLKSKLEYDEFTITTDQGIIYDVDLDDNLPSSLKGFGIVPTSNGFITVSDDSDEPRVNLVLSMSGRPDEDSPDLQLNPSVISLPLKPAATPEGEQENGTQDANDATALGKRKREAVEELDNIQKKAKANHDDAVTILEDDGAILLDD